MEPFESRLNACGVELTPVLLLARLAADATAANAASLRYASAAAGGCAAMEPWETLPRVRTGTDGAVDSAAEGKHVGSENASGEVAAGLEAGPSRCTCWSGLGGARGRQRCSGGGGSLASRSTCCSLVVAAARPWQA
eukprot:364948-Chlamydomonas_euryale.AAC.5